MILGHCYHSLFQRLPVCSPKKQHSTRHLSVTGSQDLLLKGPKLGWFGVFGASQPKTYFFPVQFCCLYPNKNGVKDDIQMLTLNNQHIPGWWFQRFFLFLPRSLGRWSNLTVRIFFIHGFNIYQALGQWLTLKNFLGYTYLVGKIEFNLGCPPSQ